MALKGIKRGIDLQTKLKAHLPLVSCVRGMISLKNPAYDLPPRPAPFTADTYRTRHAIFDKTTSRFDINSKIIAVEGAHAVGKTEFAKQLAEEFGMLYMDFPSVEDLYINHYGEDLRNYKELLSPFNQPYAEKEFFRNPLGPLEGDGDRYIARLYLHKNDQYKRALKHIFSTGQGVVLEGNIYSNYAYVDAAYNQGWIDRNTRKFIQESTWVTSDLLLRPNIIIYLDAPVDVVQKKIKDRGNEWDKDSPVWSNRQYLTDIYNEIKRGYLKKQMSSSYVLVYDWSEAGDMEVVVEDIENLELDYIDEFSDQQMDWKMMRAEQQMSAYRFLYSNCFRNQVEFSRTLSPHSLFHAEHLWISEEDSVNVNRVFNRVDSMRFDPYWNPFMGDKVVWRWNTNNAKEIWTKPIAYAMNRGVNHYGRLNEPGYTTL